MALEYVALVKEYAVLAGPAKIVLLEIADRANPDHGDACWPSVANISARTGYSESTVRRRLAQLAGANWLAVKPQIDHHGQHSNRYRLNVLKLRALQAKAAALVSDLTETEFEPFEEEKNRLKTRPVTLTPLPCQTDSAQGVSERHPNRKEPKKKMRGRVAVPSGVRSALNALAWPDCEGRENVEAYVKAAGYGHLLRKGSDERARFDS